ncbi:elongation factor Ts, mitochondrial-like [Centruroides sculpturatus]|uniref:elongation factor Ts, mitochondrial-like n=1 Tax=Centruroides sculpturatus TaxID=218467 RepID=UPI000C6DBA3A|nr:elongation factor Ts, mitochondrial-like [Centruroides sculpturatus]
MFGQLLFRFVHTTAYRLNSAVPKAALSALRKKTGYSFVNCKKALQQFDNDLEKAEEWLHAEAQKQGWEKSQKLKGRETKQGLVGFFKQGNVASIVEVNCETDFAAKSSHFKDLMNDVLNICHNHASTKELKDSLMKVNVSSTELNSLPWQEGKTLADRLALSVTKIGENLNARRALCIKFMDDFSVTGYAHPANPDAAENSVQTGKYVGLVVYRRHSNSVPNPDFDKSLCQHIIGMDPKEIGEMESEENIKKDIKTKQKIVVDTPVKDNLDESQSKQEEDTSSSSSESSSDDDDSDNEMFEERSLLKQKFIGDPDKTVGEVLERASVQIVDFVRFECGENLEENKTEE